MEKLTYILYCFWSRMHSFKLKKKPPHALAYSLCKSPSHPATVAMEMPVYLFVWLHWVDMLSTALHGTGLVYVDLQMCSVGMQREASPKAASLFALV